MQQTPQICKRSGKPCDMLTAWAQGKVTDHEKYVYCSCCKCEAEAKERIRQQFKDEGYLVEIQDIKLG